MRQELMIVFLRLVYTSNLPKSNAVPWRQSAFSIFVLVWWEYDRNSHFSHRSKHKCSYMLVRARSNTHLANTKFDRLSTEVMPERTDMLVLD